MTPDEQLQRIGKVREYVVGARLAVAEPGYVPSVSDIVMLLDTCDSLAHSLEIAIRTGT